MLAISFCIFTLFFYFVHGSLLDFNGYVDITNDGPTLKGGTIKFTATLYSHTGKIPKGEFKFYWRDNTNVGHNTEIKTNNNTCTWEVTFSEQIPSMIYEVIVEVSEYEFVLWWTIATNSSRFQITDMINGKLNLVQKSFESKYIKTNSTTYNRLLVSNNETVFHNVQVNPHDLEVLNRNFTNLGTYWFIDCEYIVNTTDFKWNHTYAKINEDHLVEALIIGDKKLPPPPPTPAPITTTQSPNSTTTTTTTTSIPPNTTTTTTKKSLNLIDDSSKINVPYVCLNGSNSPVDPNKIYGYFSSNITVRAPIFDLKIEGNYWLQNYELLNLHVTCQGSGPFQYCIHFFRGIYNITGNETCDFITSLDKCEFNITRLFYESEQHTIVIVLSNELDRVISPVRVIIYKIDHQFPLFVIIVPIGFSFIAVILIVFGVSYYMQNDRRLPIEVADFDFGPERQDMRYKTFWQRVNESTREALANAQIVRCHQNIGNEDDVDFLTPPSPTISTVGNSPSRSAVDSLNNLRYGSID